MRAARILAGTSVIDEPRGGSAHEPGRGETAAGAVLRMRRSASRLRLVPVANAEALGA